MAYTLLCFFSVTSEKKYRLVVAHSLGTEVPEAQEAHLHRRVQESVKFNTIYPEVVHREPASPGWHPSQVLLKDNTLVTEGWAGRNFGSQQAYNLPGQARNQSCL